jgi:PEP-CTERM/exosortase A-associated glycosyltransferase
VKILHVLDHSIPLQSGYTFRTRAILREQRRRGWETAHVTSVKHFQPGAAEEEVDGLRFYRTAALGPVSRRVPGLREFAGIRHLEQRIEEVLARERPDILHAHSPSLNGAAALRVAGRHGIPLVYECRAFWEDAAVDHGTAREGGLRYRLTRAHETRIFRAADAVTCICEGLRADILGRGVDAKRVTVIPNAVDIDAFTLERRRDEALAARLGITDAPVIGFIGSFYAYEGLALALEALVLLRARMPRLRLLLVGGGPQEANLRARAEQLGLREAVVFAGRVPHGEVSRYYDLVDAFVYPRLSMRLTELVTPLKPLEAMAQGRLVVASDVGGHRELIRDGETGVLFRAGDACALADAVFDLFAHRERWPCLQASGRRFVEQDRNWEASVARYEPIYGRLLGAGRQGR